MYNQRVKKLFTRTRALSTLIGIAATLLFLVVVAASFPTILAIDIKNERAAKDKPLFTEFPVTVDPHNKKIVESADVNALLESEHSPLQAAAGSKSDTLNRVFTYIASIIAETPWYQALAGADAHFVVIRPGMRREQVASAFGSSLGWSSAERKAFLTPTPGNVLPLPEGSFAPGTYQVERGTKPVMAQAIVNEKFSRDILARYSTTTAAVVPLEQALTIASLIEREAGGPDDIRLISGIIWNRLFLGMNLQIDATLQYAKATALGTPTTWPKVIPSDKNRKSAYNTYQSRGLPPGPIASPSVAAVLAALNPKSTSCLFYFHDKYGEFHCSDTYAAHVALLKQYYGQGR